MQRMRLAPQEEVERFNGFGRKGVPSERGIFHPLRGKGSHPFKMRLRKCGGELSETFAGLTKWQRVE
jgi:hypothetical protein